MKSNNKKNRFFSRWLTITIQTSHLIFFVVAIILLVAVGIVFFYGGELTNMKHRDVAEKTLEEVDALIDQATEKKIPKYELNPVNTLVERSREFLHIEDFRSARIHAEDAKQQMEYLLATYKPEVEGVTGRFARIIEIHGCG